MTAGEWAALLGGIALLVTALGGALVGIVKTLGELRVMRQQIAEVHHESTPNSGASMHDAVVLKIAPRLDQVADRIEEIAARQEVLEQAAADRRVDHDRRLNGMESDVRGIRRDVGRLADDNRTDRDRAEAVHRDLWAAIRSWMPGNNT